MIIQEDNDSGSEGMEEIDGDIRMELRHPLRVQPKFPPAHCCNPPGGGH